MGPDHVGARRQHLAELHIGGAQLFQRMGEAFAGIVSAAANGDEARELAQDPRRRGERLLVFLGKDRVMARQRPCGARKAGEIENRTKHGCEV